MRNLNFVRLCICIAATIIWITPGIRQQLGLGGPTNSTEVRPPRGGIVQRLNSSDSGLQSTSTTQQEPSGIRKRLALDASAKTKLTDDAPLAKSLKQSWTRGRISTKDALKFGRDGEKLRSNGHGGQLRNLQRKITIFAK